MKKDRAGFPPRRPARPSVPQIPTAPGQLPDVEALRRFIADSPGRVGKREISRAFNLTEADRPALRALLRRLGAEGTIAPAGARRFRETGRLPEVMTVRVTGTDPDGDPIARPVPWDEPGPPPLVLMAAERRGHPALAPGETVLARLRPIGPGRYEGRTVKRLSEAPGRILGVFRAAPRGQADRHTQGHPTHRPEAGRVLPTDRRAKAEWVVPHGEHNDAEHDELVLAEPLPRHGPFGLKPARIVERLGRMGEARSISLIAIHTHAIPRDFPAEALAQAAASGAPTLEGREDLRAIPLITIDGADARDFDDAVFAEPTADGFRLIVAIADVAHYVPAGSALDREARRRGNSVYFPDRVVPMLPEALSNNWCSLRPHEDRACLFVEMKIDRAGRKQSHRFGRGLMRSAARLTYEAVQTARDTDTDPTTPEGMPAMLAPGILAALYDAFTALLAARTARGTLDLDLPERQVILDAEGKVAAVRPRPRLDSHKLIEEFMIAANVAAAEELERRGNPCVYRVHAPPSDEKRETLAAFLHSLGISLAPGNQLHPRDLDAVLRKVADSEIAPMVNEMMLRSQSQAAYDIANIGHFGLALTRYAHFTSPIRRYADLLVHRALLGMLTAPDGLAETAAHITGTERRAQLAERDSLDRYLAAFMAERRGAEFTARISGVTRFGVFVTVTENGASGLVPMSSLPDDDWMHDAGSQTLNGRRTRIVLGLGAPLAVRLAEANPLTGGLIFHPLLGAGAPGRTSKPPQGKRRRTQ